MSKCKNRSEILNIFNAFKDYSDEQREVVATGMQASGVLEKCRDGVDVADIFEFLKIILRNIEMRSRRG